MIQHFNIFYIIISISLSFTNGLSAPEIPSTKQKLIQKARQINPPDLSLEGKNRFTTGWSNRLGSILTPVAEGVYTSDRPFLWNNIDVGCRMTVVELSTKTAGKTDLFIHSPVFLDDSLKASLDRIGHVAHVVSPNYEHVKFAKKWGETFQDCKMWACPGMMAKEPDVRWTGEIPYGARPSNFPSTTSKPDPVEGMWDWNEVQPLHFNTEVNPFNGKPFFNEVVFYYAASKTLMVTDTYWNYPRDGETNSNYKDLPEYDEALTGPWEMAPYVSSIPFGTRLWKIGMDKLFKPFYMNLMVTNESKDEFRIITAFLSGIGPSSLDIEILIPAHGDIVRGAKLIRAVLKNHFGL